VPILKYFNPLLLSGLIVKHTFVAMRYKLFVFIGLFCLLRLNASAANYTFDYDNNCNRAYQYYMSMHLAEGNAAIIQEIRQNPYNLMATFLADYDDCLVLMMNGDRGEYEQRKDHFDERLDLISKGSDNSPWYRLCKAGIYFHWALIHLRFGENFKAATTFRKSYQLLKENQEKFPDFDYNKVFYGVEETIAGTIPDSYKWIAAAFGIKGDVKKGVSLLGTFLNSHNNNDPLHLEAVILDVYLRFYLSHQQPQVWDFLNSDQFPTNNNLVNLYIKTNIAVNYRKADIAIALLKSNQASPDYNRYPMFDYNLANALFLKLDPSCIYYFQRYLKNDKSKTYIKDCWQKLALMYYMDHNMQQANYCRSRISGEGNAQVDADKQAKRFGENNNWPNLTLLAARLLIDGGYNAEAFSKLNSVTEKSFNNNTDKLEYYFRLGRVYDEMNNEAKAIQCYRTTINMGRYQPEQFAARAALQMGFYYERTGRKKEAIDSYKECLQMHDHDYQASIDQQAKAGINRLSEN